MAQEVDHQTVTAEGGGFGSTESQTLFVILTTKNLLDHVSAGYEHQNEGMAQVSKHLSAC